MHITIMPGDGIGPEIMAEAEKLLAALDLPDLQMTRADVGGAAYQTTGHPLPADTLDLARKADAILFGAVGDPAYDHLDRDLRPEQAILGLRKELGLFANLRPAVVLPGLEEASSLKPDIARNIDVMIVRELMGDVYFGQPRGRRETSDGRREGFDTMRYDEDEIARIAHVAFRMARSRRGRLCSVDKANVLETSVLWREVMSEVAAEYSDVELSHMYVDNAAMQMVRNPGQFDTIVTGNLFGDILSDQASMCVGSIGLLASASLGEGGRGLYEPIHGSAPDIAGQGIANPIAMLLSVAMMLRFSFEKDAMAARIVLAVGKTLTDGVVGHDMGGTAGTQEIGSAVIERL